MEVFWFLFGLTIGGLIVMVIKSFYLPKTRTITAIMRFGKLHTFISNIEGKKVLTEINGSSRRWDIVDKSISDSGGNIYFFLWPIYKPYQFHFTYTKAKKIGEEQPGDIVIWKDEDANECVISRSVITSSVEFRAEYPVITTKLETKELASVTTNTNNIIEITNPALALFGIDDWFRTSSEILNGALRRIVANRKLHELNQFSGEVWADNFNKSMKDLVNKFDEEHPGLENIGVKLYKSIFKDFKPADEKARKLMDSYTNVTIAEQEVEVKLKTAKGDADAYSINQKAIVEWQKKYLIDTGLAKVDAQGNIIELVPDANSKISAEALKELSKLTGTLVLDSGSLNKLFTINPTRKGW